MSKELPDFTGVYQGRMVQELAYLAQTLAALHSVHQAMSQSIGFTEPKLQATEAEFMRLLEQSLYYINRELSAQLSPRKETKL